LLTLSFLRALLALTFWNVIDLALDTSTENHYSLVQTVGIKALLNVQ